MTATGLQRSADEGLSDPLRQSDPIWLNCGDALLLADAETGKVVDANPRAEQLFGFSRGQLCTMHQSMLHPMDQRELVESHFQTASGGGAGKFGDIDVLCADGSRVPVGIRTSVLELDGRRLVLGSFRDIRERREAETSLRRSNWALSALLRANMAAIQAGTDNGLMQSVCEAIASDGVFTLAWIGTAEENPEKSVKLIGAAGPAIGYISGLRISWGVDEFGRGPTGRCIRENRTIINNDTATNPDFQPWALHAAKFGIVSSLSIPLIDEGRAFGALTVYADRTEVFGADELRLFEQFALSLVFAMKARRAHWKYRSAMEQMVGALAATIERRDPYTAGHERRVAGLAVSIAKEMGFDDEHCRVIRLAGEVHDIGKIQVPAEILNKPGKLSSLEFELVKTHVTASRELLQGIDFPWPLADIAAQHHERLDGTGYPNGLCSDKISIEAKIIAVADVLEAISSHRPYRPALGIEVGLEEIRRQRGIQLDAEAVDAAIRLCAADGFKF